MVLDVADVFLEDDAQRLSGEISEVYITPMVVGGGTRCEVSGE